MKYSHDHKLEQQRKVVEGQDSRGGIIAALVYEMSCDIRASGAIVVEYSIDEQSNLS